MFDIQIPQSFDDDKNNNNNHNNNNRLGGEYDHQSAMFGLQPQGVSMIQPLFYADSSFCTSTMPPSPPPDEISFYPTSPLTITGVKRTPFFLLLNRGGCSFIQKILFFVLSCLFCFCTTTNHVEVVAPGIVVCTSPTS